MTSGLCHVCGACGSKDVDTTLRTSMVTYCRCRSCGNIWTHRNAQAAGAG